MTLNTLPGDFAAHSACAAEMATAIAAGDPSVAEHFFTQFGGTAPRIAWAPAQDALSFAPLRDLLAYWLRITPAGYDMPVKSAIGPIQMRSALGNILLIDLIDGGRDGRYRLYGTRIAEMAGKDWTGKLISDMAMTSYTAIFYLAVYRAAILRRLPVLTFHMAEPHLPTPGWERLILPLADDQGAVSRFLVGNFNAGFRLPPVEPPPHLRFAAGALARR